jgi:hypothetical protein
MKAVILGAIAVFVWNAISWTVLPWHNATMHTLPNEQVVMDMLSDTGIPSGVYYFPGMPEDQGGQLSSEEMTQQWLERHRRGPLGLLFYHSSGMEPMQMSTFVVGFIIMLISALLVAFLLNMGVEQMPGYGQRLMFATVVGIFAAFVSHVSMWNWFYFPAGYTLVNFFDMVISWFIGGLVIAWRVKPKATP